MIPSLLLPVVISAVALFFASFLSWMVVQLHRKDWVKLDREEDFLKAVRELGISPGSYTFPGYANAAEMKSDAFKAKVEAGPMGILTVFPGVNMGRNLGLTFLYFFAVSFGIGYLAWLALTPGSAFMAVFRFVSTVAFLIFLAAMVQHAIWFRARIVGHVVESIAYAAIVGTIFGAMWPAS